MVTVSKFSVFLPCFWGRGADKRRSHTQCASCSSSQRWRMAIRYQPRIPTCCVLQGFCLMVSVILKCYESYQCKDREPFKCPFVDIIELRVFIHPDTCSHCLTRLLSNLFCPPSSGMVQTFPCRDQWVVIAFKWIWARCPLLCDFH